jgi:excisionase family DNA binding protein
MARRYDLRRVKSDRCYTISEAAKLLGAHPRTLMRWINHDGLPLIERKRPFLIHGSELRAFLKARQPARQKCRPGEIFCLPCRAPKRPAGDMVDYIPKTTLTGLVEGICPDCGSMIYRVARVASLDAACGNLSVTRRPLQPRLIDSSAPKRNVHFGKKTR